MSDETQLLEVPARNDLAAPSVANRPGYRFKILGHCLKADGPLWSAAQRESGITLEMVFLNSSEEESAINEAVAAGAIATAPFLQMRRALYAVDGAKIGHMDKADVWEQLGGQGRNLASSAFQFANAPAKEALEAMKASFCVSG